MVLDLRHPPGAALPAWAPGAHIDLVLARRPGAAVLAVRRSGRPLDLADRRAARARGPGRLGACARRAARRATTVEVRGPRNHFPLQPAPRYLFVAGGIGITPILPMLAAADAAGARVATAVRRPYARRPWPSPRSWRRYGDRVDLRPQDEHGLLDLEASLARAGRRTPSSTAAGPPRCWTPSRSAVPGVPPARCTWSGSRRRTPANPCWRGVRGRTGRYRDHLHRAARSGRSSTSSRRRA